MKWIFVVAFLSGCASLPPEDYRQSFQKRADEITAHFNQLAGTSYKTPDIRWSDEACEEGNTTGEANIRFNVIWISTDCAKRFPQQTMDDILPHEEAHIFVNRFYGQDEGHDFIWQQTAIKLGMTCLDNEITYIELCH